MHCKMCSNDSFINRQDLNKTTTKQERLKSEETLANVDGYDTEINTMNDGEIGMEARCK